MSVFALGRVWSLSSWGQYEGSACLSEWSQWTFWTPRLRWTSDISSTLQVLPYTLAGRIKFAPCDNNEKRYFETYTWLLLDVSNAPFPISNFYLYLFTIMDCNTNKAAFLIPPSPSSELSGLRVTEGKHNLARRLL